MKRAKICVFWMTLKKLPIPFCVPGDENPETDVEIFIWGI